MAKRPVMLHVLPSFDVGGLGSLALTMIDAWPVPDVRHIAIAPQYPTTRPVLRPVFERMLDRVRPGDVHGKKSVWEVRRNIMSPPTYVTHLAAGIRSMLEDDDEIVGCIHYNHTDLAWSIQAIRRWFKGPVLSHIGTRLNPKNADQTGPFRSKFTKHGVVFVPPSKAVRDAAVECMETCKSTVALAPVLWNGVNIQKWRAGISRRPIGPTELSAPLHFGFTGRMAPEAKAWDFLFDSVRALELLCTAADHRFHFQIAGDGPLRHMLEAKAPKSVKFIGEMLPAAIPDFLAGLDAYFMAALPVEGMSMALIEAIAAELPVVSTDVESTREAMGIVGAPDEDGNTIGPGGMVALRPEGAARLMFKLIRDEDFLFERVVAAGAWSETHFSAREMARKYAELGGWL